VKKIRTRLVSTLLFKKKWCCFGHFDIAGCTQYRYIVDENKIRILKGQFKMDNNMIKG
jgi:hypothetical protein